MRRSGERPASTSSKRNLGKIPSCGQGKRATKNPGVAPRTPYTEEDRKFFQRKILEIMELGRSFNGAVASVRKVYAKQIRTPDRVTFYRWLDEHPTFRELVETIEEDNYGKYEEAEKLIVEGGFITSEEKTAEYYEPRSKKEEHGPLKKEKTVTSRAAPNPQAALRGMDRRSRHIRRWVRAEGKKRTEALSEVPGPSELKITDAEGKEIPLCPIRIVFGNDVKKEGEK